MHNGVRCHKLTTQGWQLFCQWKDGSTNWVALNDTKNLYHVQVVDYAVAYCINDEPAFAWWVPIVFKKCQWILSKVKTKYWQHTHKFSICLPKSVAQAQAIDKENGNTLWWDAIVMEMKNVQPAFKKYEKEENNLIGYQKIKCHFIFNIKISENFW